MKKILAFLQDNYEATLYLGAVLLLLLAIFKPQIQLRQEVHNYLLLADVSQSMNAEDVQINKQN
ncbi:MAG TPA: VWA domain-containing protein, partial [Methyloradius sp.]